MLIITGLLANLLLSGGRSSKLTFAVIVSIMLFFIIKGLMLALIGLIVSVFRTGDVAAVRNI